VNQGGLFDEGLPKDRLTDWPPNLAGIDASWRALVQDFLDSQTGQDMSFRMQQALQAGVVIYPPEPFRALCVTPLAQVRVVILGQDPYHGPGQAEGLAFSVPEGGRIPPSLRNIFKELQNSLGRTTSNQGSLLSWAHQGVLLLNTCFTVEQGRPGSHAKWGWESLTDAVVTAVAQAQQPVVFMLWGAHAQAKKGLIQASSAEGLHLILEANHPSPLSAMRPPVPFMGCGHFELANAFLQTRSKKTIKW
jgi:uracil-DNA glycosylase